MAVVRDQQVFRIRTDATAAEGGTPVWAAAQNTVAIPPVNTAFRIRFAIASTGANNPAASIYTLQVSQNGGAYAQIPSSASTNPVYATDATGGASADNSAITTSLLSGATGVFLAGQYDDTGATSSFVITHADYTEIEYGIKFQYGKVSVGDTYAFRVYANTTALDTYTQTPTLTIPVAGIPWAVPFDMPLPAPFMAVPGFAFASPAALAFVGVAWAVPFRPPPPAAMVGVGDGGGSSIFFPPSVPISGMAWHHALDVGSVAVKQTQETTSAAVWPFTTLPPAAAAEHHSRKLQVDVGAMMVY